MHTERITYFLRALFSAAVAGCFGAAFLVRCATINPQLTGGPRDTLPPVILRMTPDNGATEYPLSGANRKIYIEFDEFVQFKNQQKEFYTSPMMKKKPLLSIRGRGIVIQMRDTLLENQTYALDFGSALCDNNEGNPLHGMRYVFSTGTEIDSMLCSGYTADSYKADSVSKTFIWFFPADSVDLTPDYDSTIFNHKPAAIARAQTNGIFIAQNLKPVDYRIYAIEDKNDNQLYDPSVDQVGFLPDTYNPAQLPDFAIWFDSLRNYVTAEPQLYFRMFTDEAFKRQYLAQSERPRQHQATLYFGAPLPRITAIEFDSIPRERVIVDPQTVGRDTVSLWFDLPAAELPDTIRGRITYFKHDSINELTEVTEDLKLMWRFIETKEQQKEREKQERAREKAEAAGEEYVAPEVPNPFTYKLSTTGDVNPEKGVYIDFDYPVMRFDTASVVLTREVSVEEQQAENRENNRRRQSAADSSGPVQRPETVHFRRDTLNLRRWHLDMPWRPSSKYRLHIPAGAVTDVAGFSNDSIGANYTTLDPEKFATIKIELTPRTGYTGSYIVQLLSSSGSLQQEKAGVRGGTVQFNYVPAGEVKFRIIEDANENGKWDSGSVVLHRDPERVELFVDETEGTDTFATKVNWEIETAMDMNRLFAPMTMEALVEMLDKREMLRLMKLEADRAKNGTQTQNGTSGGGFGMGGAFNASTLRSATNSISGSRF